MSRSVICLASTKDSPEQYICRAEEAVGGLFSSDMMAVLGSALAFPGPTLLTTGLPLPYLSTPQQCVMTPS